MKKNFAHNRTKSIFLIVCCLFSCTSYMLKEKDFINLRKDLSKRVFLTKKKLYSAFEDKSDKKSLFFKKNTKVTLNLEQGGDWLRVRAYRFVKKEDEESNQGKIILYFVQDFLSKQQQEDFKKSDIKEALNKLLVEVKN